MKRNSIRCLPFSFAIALATCLLAMVIACGKSGADERPDVDTLPHQPGYPDPLVMQDGTRITSAEDWFAKRRPELKALFQHYMYGHLPAKPKRMIVEKVLFTDSNYFGGKATISETRLAFQGPDLSNRLHVLLVVPNHKTGPVPLFLALNFCGNHAITRHPQIHIPEGWIYKKCEGVVHDHASDAGRGGEADDWSLERTIDRGYGLASFYNGDIDPDTPEFTDGILPAFYEPGQTSPKSDDPGTIAAWAWGFHRAVDFLIEHHGQTVDPKRIITVGHSRNGKTALLAAAMDERIAMAIPSQAGCGGTAPNRVAIDAGKVETVARINEVFPHWFCDNFTRFGSAPDRLPFDQHCLIALCAPRPVLLSNAIEDVWANPDGQFDMLKAAAPVYELLGAGTLDAVERPEIGHLVDSKLGYFIRPGKHAMTSVEWEVFLKFADKHVGKSATKE